MTTERIGNLGMRRGRVDGLEIARSGLVQCVVANGHADRPREVLNTDNSPSDSPLRYASWALVMLCLPWPLSVWVLQPGRRRSQGTIFHRREQLEWPENDFRILSIDGGGIKGILPAAVLAECERRFLKGGSAAGYFDMVAGTSTGGIIALGMAAGMRAEEVLEI